MSVEAEIDGMKALLRVGTDGALAVALRLDRTNVSHWRRRGQVSTNVLRRAEMIARHGQLAPEDSLERVTADAAILCHRMQAGHLAPAAIADMLSGLADRARALGRAS